MSGISKERAGEIKGAASFHHAGPGGLFPAEGLFRPAVVQRAVQYGFLLFYLYVGWRFFWYVQWAMGKSEEFAARPPSVEAFLPISALLGAKRLLYTGAFDPIHPAGLTIFLCAVASALLLRRGFCGYLCPVGAASSLLDRLGRRLGISRRPGKILSFLLSAPKYLLLLFFVRIIVMGMGVDDIEHFLQTPYNRVADTKMLLFFWPPTPTLLVALGVLGLGSMLIPGFWCRGFCPYGALLGLFSWLSPVAVRRDAASCTGCRRCTGACPSRIPVHEKLRVTGPECTGCVACVDACQRAYPGRPSLALRLGWSKKAARLPAQAAALGTLALLCAFFAWANLTGHWDARIAPETARELHRNVERVGHP